MKITRNTTENLANGRQIVLCPRNTNRCLIHLFIRQTTHRTEHNKWDRGEKGEATARSGSKPKSDVPRQEARGRGHSKTQTHTSVRRSTYYETLRNRNPGFFRTISGDGAQTTCRCEETEEEKTKISKTTGFCKEMQKKIRNTRGAA